MFFWALIAKKTMYYHFILWCYCCKKPCSECLHSLKTKVIEVLLPAICRHRGADPGDPGDESRPAGGRRAGCRT